MRFHKSVQMLEKLTIFAIFPSKSPSTFAFIATYGAIGINSLERVKALILDARLETFYRNIKIYTDLFNIISIKNNDLNAMILSKLDATMNITRNYEFQFDLEEKQRNKNSIHDGFKIYSTMGTRITACCD